MYPGLNIKPDEVFVSDGSKCDIGESQRHHCLAFWCILNQVFTRAGRLNILFGFNAKVAVQDPAYPVYVDSSVIFGRSRN